MHGLMARVATFWYRGFSGGRPTSMFMFSFTHEVVQKNIFFNWNNTVIFCQKITRIANYSTFHCYIF